MHGRVSLSYCFLGSFKILSDTLKILFITNCYSYVIQVSAPNVCSLRLTIFGKVHLDRMPFLVSAWVYLCDGGVSHPAQSGYDLIAAICNAQHLELFRFNLFLQDIMENSTLEGLSFCKLKSLYIGEWRVIDFYGPLAYFLQCAPNWAALTLDQWKLKPVSALTRDIGEFRKVRLLLKEKTKPKETEVVWF
uniref:FBD domain-containing protein n=1 Tax=Setaria italica TaxID=4555 RepID=K3Z070_SETIT